MQGQGCEDEWTERVRGVGVEVVEEEKEGKGWGAVGGAQGVGGEAPGEAGLVSCTIVPSVSR